MGLVALSSMLALLADACRTADHLALAPSGPSLVTVLAGAVLAAALVAGLAKASGFGQLSAAVPLTRRATAMREKDCSTSRLRQRDPDADGRPRPRAPAAAPAAASS